MSFHEQLIDATAAERAHFLAAPVIADCLQGRVRLESYLAFLGQAYHHVRHTTPLLMTLGGRLPERLSWLRRAGGRDFRAVLELRYPSPLKGCWISV